MLQDGRRHRAGQARRRLVLPLPALQGLLDLRIAPRRLPRFPLRVDAVGEAGAGMEAGPGQVRADGDRDWASRGLRRSRLSPGLAPAALLSGAAAVGARARRQPDLLLARGRRVDRQALHPHPSGRRDRPRNRRGGRGGPDRLHDDSRRAGLRRHEVQGGRQPLAASGGQVAAMSAYAVPPHRRRRRATRRPERSGWTR